MTLKEGGRPESGFREDRGAARREKVGRTEMLELINIGDIG